MPEQTGAMPSQIIRAMMDAGFIRGAWEENVKPASLDLTITDEIYHVAGSFLPRPSETVREIIKEVDPRPHDLSHLLERNVTYIARLAETLALPETIYAYCNPKSSTGRNDVQVRVVADGVTRYDAATPRGFSGELWLLIEPKSFLIRLAAGATLAQIRFFNANTRFNELDLEISFKRDLLLWRGDGSEPYEYKDIRIRDNDGSIILTLDLGGDIAGWECLGRSRVFDFGKVGHYAPEEFFRWIPGGGRLHLKQGGFYILYTRERVRVPLHLACEMVAMDARSGEFRSHYAGYIDPGWGWGRGGEGRGRQLVLEVRPFEDLILRDGQPVTKVRFERMVEPAVIGYDELDTSNYAKELPVPRLLSKHFKM